MAAEEERILAALGWDSDSKGLIDASTEWVDTDDADDTENTENKENKEDTDDTAVWPGWMLTPNERRSDIRLVAIDLVRQQSDRCVCDDGAASVTGSGEMECHACSGVCTLQGCMQRARCML